MSSVSEVEVAANSAIARVRGTFNMRKEKHYQACSLLERQFRAIASRNNSPHSEPAPVVVKREKEYGEFPISLHFGFGEPLQGILEVSGANDGRLTVRQTTYLYGISDSSVAVVDPLTEIDWNAFISAFFEALVKRSTEPSVFPTPR